LQAGASAASYNGCIPIVFTVVFVVVFAVINPLEFSAVYVVILNLFRNPPLHPKPLKIPLL
jgi:hypothetical protein